MGNRRYAPGVARARFNDVVLEGIVTTDATGHANSINFPGVTADVANVWQGVGEYHFPLQDKFKSFLGAKVAVRKNTDPGVRWYIKDFSSNVLSIQFANLSSPPAAVNLTEATFYVQITMEK